MTFKNVLVAIDDSPQASAALDLAISLSHDLGASLAIVHCVDPAIVAAAAGSEGAAVVEIELDELETAGKELLETASRRAKAAGLDVTAIMRNGDPAPTIVDTARHSDCDLIVLGTHGRHGMTRLFLGSCAESVLRQSPVPVLVKRS